MIKGALIAVRIGLARGSAEACRAADHGFIDAGPSPVLAEQVRAHEGLVVEAGAEERGEQIVYGAKVELERGPAVLTRGDEAVGELDLRRAQVWGDATRPARDGDECVRLFGAGRQNSPRPVIFERAPD